MLARKAQAGGDKRLTTIRSLYESTGGQSVDSHPPPRHIGKTAKEKQAIRAQHRQQKFGPPNVVTPTNVHSMTTLETMNVSKSRRESYAQAWEAFNVFVKTSRLQVKTLEGLDAAAVWWIDHLYFQGENVASVMTFMAAAKHSEAILRACQFCPGQHVLSRVSRSWRPDKLGFQ